LTRVPRSELGYFFDQQSKHEFLNTMSPEDVSPIDREQDIVQTDIIIDGKKDGVSGVVEELDVEEGEAHKTFYSKGSVIMMVIFSGLAIGSDG
jgi:hypothetical protein